MPGQSMRTVAQTDSIEQLAGATIGIEARHSMHPTQGACDVLLGGEMAEQVELLEHHADADAGALVGDGLR